MIVYFPFIFTSINITSLFGPIYLVLIEKWNANCFNEEHPIKALVPIPFSKEFETDDGIVILICDGQWEKFHFLFLLPKEEL